MKEMKQHTKEKGLTRVLVMSLDRGGDRSSSTKDADDNVITTLTLTSILDRASDAREWRSGSSTLEN
jgi:hypothetical protein